MPLDLNFLGPALKDSEMPFTAVLRDLNKLNTFVRVAQRRSFTKAAAELRTTPSVVSKRMKELEESLGFSLLNRSTHGFSCLSCDQSQMSLKSLSLKSIATVPPFIPPPSLLSNGRVPQPTLPVPDMIEAILVDGSPWSSRRCHGGHSRA